MASKIAIVTGGTKGIGFHVVKGLCERLPQGSVVYATGRNDERGQEAVHELREALQGKASGTPTYQQLDVSDREAVKSFARSVRDNHGRVDILVNNAGMAFPMAAQEPFSVQVRETLKTNFWGTLSVCEEFLSLLAPHARVVNVSSSSGELRRISGDEPAAAGLRSRFSAEDLTTEQLSDLIREFEKVAMNCPEDKVKEAGWPLSAYAVSKVGVSALSRVLHRELSRDPTRPDIVVNYVHPGHIQTDLSRHTGEKSPETGASPIIFAALLPTDTPIRGEFIWEDCTVVDWVHGFGQAGGFSQIKDPVHKHTKEGGGRVTLHESSTT